ncbi:MAG: hypothetical protein GF333_08010 [Candidatus Omnitrophica bacterium]|nr:hypothetical protein [Candidatus Omnitrophota bacterium]
MRDLRHKGQSLLEMAILGPVLLMAFGIVVTYIAKANADQYQLQEAFRRALKKSHDENKAISYGTWDDRRQASPEDPGIGQKLPASGAGFVLWAIPSVDERGEDTQDNTYVKMNEVMSIRGIPIEYNLGPGGSGAVEKTYYISGTNKTLNVNTNNRRTTSSMSAVVGETMIYKINGQHYAQGRAHFQGGSLSGGGGNDD